MSVPSPYQLPTNSHPTPTMVGDGRVLVGCWSGWGRDEVWMKC